MALTQISTAGVKDDAVTSGKIPANAVGSSELADNAVDTAAIADDAVTDAKLANSINSAIAANTAKASITINNNADNRVITGSGTANTLEGESNLTFDGSHLILGSGKGIKTNYIRHADGSNTNTGAASQQYWKIGDINLNGSEGAVITLVGANGYSAGSTQFAAETTIVLRGSNGSTLLGFWYSDSGSAIATYSDVRWKHSSGTTFELWVSAGPFNNVAPAIVKTTGSFDNTNAAGTNSNNAPTGSTALPTNHCKQIGTIQTIEYQSTGTIFKRNVVMDNGYGIDFSATANASQGGASNHDELLDDYEEGKWNPGIDKSSSSMSVSYTTSTGTYTKVGRLVTVWFDITVASGGTSGGGAPYITELPFAAVTGDNNDNGGYGAPTFRAATLMHGDFRIYGTSSYFSNSQIYLQHYNSSGSTVNSSFNGSGRITGQGTYFTTT